MFRAISNSGVGWSMRLEFAGKLVRSVFQQKSINIETLVPGIYIVKIVLKDGTTCHQKVIKEVN